MVGARLRVRPTVEQHSFASAQGPAGDASVGRLSGTENGARAGSARGDDHQRVALARQQHHRASVRVDDLQCRAKQSVEHRLELTFVGEGHADFRERFDHRALIRRGQHRQDRWDCVIGRNFLQHPTRTDHRHAPRGTIDQSRSLW